MRLTARDQESFFHLIVLLQEAGYSGVPVGGNELVIPDDAYVADEELRAEFGRVLLPGTAMVPAGPVGVSAPQELAVPPAAPMPGPGTGMLGPTPGQRPPTHGPGSSQVEQLRYATQLGLAVRGDMTRDELVGLIDQHESEIEASREAPSDG